MVEGFGYGGGNVIAMGEREGSERESAALYFRTGTTGIPSRTFSRAVVT
jgi:hypothetical protein